jgi:hypothetical protein
MSGLFRQKAYIFLFLTLFAVILFVFYESYSTQKQEKSDRLLDEEICEGLITGGRCLIVDYEKHSSEVRYIRRVFYKSRDVDNYFFEYLSYDKNFADKSDSYCRKYHSSHTTNGIYESGILFKFDSFQIDTISYDEDDCIVYLSDTLYNKEFGNIVSDTTYVFTLKEVPETNSHMKYYFSRSLKLFLGWDVLAKNNVIKYKRLLDIDTVNINSIDTTFCD